MTNDKFFHRAASPRDFLRDNVKEFCFAKKTY